MRRSTSSRSRRMRRRPLRRRSAGRDSTCRPCMRSRPSCFPARTIRRTPRTSILWRTPTSRRSWCRGHTVQARCSHGASFDAPRVTPAETEDGKQELGLPRTPTVFVNAGGKDAVEILGLLADQGDIINIACYAEDVKLLAALRTRADRAETRSNVVLITRKDMFREYLLMSDIVITRFEPSVVYTCFKAGKPVIAFGKGAEEEKTSPILPKGSSSCRRGRTSTWLR